MSENFPDTEERCTDPIDQACQTETRIRENDVALARAKARFEQEPVRDSAGEILYWPITECVDCEDSIHPARLALGRVRCVPCQEAVEKRNKLHG